MPLGDSKKSCFCTGRAVQGVARLVEGVSQMMESPFEAIASKDLGVGPGQGDLPETWYANRRKSGFVYLSRSFPARFGADSFFI